MLSRRRVPRAIQSAFAEQTIYPFMATELQHPTVAAASKSNLFILPLRLCKGVMPETLPVKARMTHGLPWIRLKYPLWNRRTLSPTGVFL